MALVFRYFAFHSVNPSSVIEAHRGAAIQPVRTCVTGLLRLRLAMTGMGAFRVGEIAVDYFT
jgi:alpha-D-ribose 1-methylphosphonate 5-triphosphate synthase subunit PhnG